MGGPQLSPVIDCAVRVEWASQDELIGHLEPGWREYIGRPGTMKGGVGGKNISLSLAYHHPDGDYVAGGLETCAEPRRLAAALAKEISTAVLLPGRGMLIPADNNSVLTVQLCRAVNDWLADRWLSADSRFRGSVLVPNQLPNEAAAELRRCAGDPRFVQVLMVGNGLGKPFGHPIYHPIYEAAAEAGLPIAIHLGGDAVPDTLTHPTAGGLPATYTEYRVIGAQALMTHVVSLIGQGVFERFPALRVVVVGGGVTWIPPLIWRMDVNFNAFGREAPWLTKKPSEYFREHFLVAAQPLERPLSDGGRLRRLLASFRDMNRVLCFASAYPEQEMETPERVAAAMPPEWIRSVLFDNAASAYGPRVLAAVTT